MPAPLDVAFHNHYNDVYENKAVNVPTYSNQVKNSRQYKQNMVNMMNNSNTSTNSSPRYPWPVNVKIIMLINLIFIEVQHPFI